MNFYQRGKVETSSLLAWTRSKLFWISNEMSLKDTTSLWRISFSLVLGAVGVPDMTVISDIDEDGINKNLQARYSKDLIYVSFFFST